MYRPHFVYRFSVNGRGVVLSAAVNRAAMNTCKQVGNLLPFRETSLRAGWTMNGGDRAAGREQ